MSGHPRNLPFDVSGTSSSSAAGSSSSSVTFPTGPGSPLPPVQSFCDQMGHTAAETETVRYVDGLIVGRCERCDCRLTMRVPGGAHVPEAKALASTALDMARDDKAAAALELLETFRATLIRDRAALSEALSIFDTVRAGIAQMLGQK